MYRYVPQRCKNILIFWSLFFVILHKHNLELDEHVEVRPEDRILTLLYRVSTLQFIQIE